MIGEIYVLNKNLEPIGIVDGYKSCIWSNRYNDLGDCELYIQASVDNFLLFSMGNYLARIDDEMVCKINKIEIDTSTEEGNYLIITGTDAKCLLGQRIIWGTATCKGAIEGFIRQIITDAIISPSVYPEKRVLLKENGEPILHLGDPANFTDATSEQVSYANVEEKVKEYCKAKNWGYRVVLRGTSLYFELYKGEDRSDWVVFSPEYENLATTQYIDDATKMGNVALVCGSGEGSDRAQEVVGQNSGMDRFEVYVDARDLAKKIKYSDLISTYPGGSVVTVGTNEFYYRLPSFDIQIFNDDQLAELQVKYPTGQIKIVNDVKYYEVYNVNIASLYSATPADNDDAILLDVVYDVFLIARGYDKMSEYGEKVSFDGVVEPTITFEYKKDYFLGDVVTVRNEYGVSLEARIVEIVEVSDENGYNVEPRFEYVSTNQEV